MTRSLDAPLSPHEEATLRRVANGITKVKHLAPDHVRRLKHLALAEDNGGRLKLTTFGLQRYAALPKADSMAGLGVADDFTRKFEKYLGQS
jgi:predicted nuclease with RNAse H fold